MKTYNTLFFGTPDFAVPVLDTLIKLPFIDLKAVITQPDKPVGKKQTITPPPVKIFALNNNITVLQPTKIKNNEFIETIKNYKPEIIIIIAYGKIISKKLLNIPKFGWLNIHASLLPKYRGASPIQAVLLNGEDKTGVTLMKIDKGLDTGPIISQLETPIAENENAETLHDKLSKLGSDIVTKDLLSYLEGELSPQTQTESPSLICKTINKQDGKIDWNNSAENIERQIRAYTPWPGTYTFWENKRIKIIEAEIIMHPNKLEPGLIFLHSGNYLVGTKKNSIKLKKIQLAGKKPTDIQSFIKGYPDFANAKLT